MWLVKQMLSVFIWVLTIVGSALFVMAAIRQTSELGLLGLYTIIGAFLLCWGYFGVKYVDLKESSK